MKEGKKWNTAPFDVAKEISKSLASNALISKVNGVLWDMNRPLEEDCKLELFTFDTDEGRDTFWHSSAHILGEVRLFTSLVILFNEETSSSDLIIGYVIWFWLFQSLEQTYGCRLCIGPCTTRGEVKLEPVLIALLSQRLMVPFEMLILLELFFELFKQELLIVSQC